MGVIPVQQIAAVIGGLALLIAGFFGGTFSAYTNTFGSSLADADEWVGPLERASFSDSGYSYVTDPSRVKEILAKGLKAPSKFPLIVSADFEKNSHDGIGFWYQKIDNVYGSGKISEITDDGAVKIGNMFVTDVSPHHQHNAALAEVLLSGGPIVIAFNKDSNRYLLGCRGNASGIVMVAKD